MEMEYTYFEAEDGFFVGWFDNFPEDVTQGKSLEELEEMLVDMYECLNLAKYHKRKLVLAVSPGWRLRYGRPRISFHL